MHQFLLPILAAFACALCNGTAAVLQKISADKEKKVSSMDAGLLWRLFQDKPYIAGITLDIIGWVATLYAVHYLPLFLVEAIIAANIVVTALIERFFRHRSLGRAVYAATIIIVLGLVALSFASSPEKAEPVSNVLRWTIVLIPLLLGSLGYFLARFHSYRTSIGLAVIGGLAFGGTSVAGRIFSFSRPLWHTVYNPLIFALVASGAIGILLFSIALQRAQATVINATMTASQTLIPAIVGITFLGDDARNGLWYLVVIGTALVLGGVTGLVFAHNK